MYDMENILNILIDKFEIISHGTIQIDTRPPEELNLNTSHTPILSGKYN